MVGENCKLTMVGKHLINLSWWGSIPPSLHPLPLPEVGFGDGVGLIISKLGRYMGGCTQCIGCQYDRYRGTYVMYRGTMRGTACSVCVLSCSIQPQDRGQPEQAVVFMHNMTARCPIVQPEARTNHSQQACSPVLSSSSCSLLSCSCPARVKLVSTAWRK